MKDIFISYNWESKSAVQKIVDLLETKNGYKIWLDDYVMNAGDSLHGEIMKGIDNCKLFVAFITKKYCESKNCRLEIKYAFQKSKKCIYVKLEEDLGKDEAGIGLLVADTLWINGYDYQSHNNWPLDLYTKLSHDISKHLNNEDLPQLIDLKGLITCRTCKSGFNLEECGKDSCRKPMQTNCNIHKIHENVLCMKCLVDRKRRNCHGIETYLCPFDNTEHLWNSFTDVNRLHNIIRYFEVKDCFSELRDDINYYNNFRNITTNMLVFEVNESKRKIKEHIEVIINELNNYVTEMVQKLDKKVEEWRVKQEQIKEFLKLDEIVKSTEESMNELENDLKKIEIAVKRNEYSSIDEHVNKSVARTTTMYDAIIRINSQITNESKKLNDEISFIYKKGNKISDFKQVVGFLEMNKIHAKKLGKITNENSSYKIERLIVDVKKSFLSLAYEDNNVKIKELVEKNNANVNLKNNKGETPLISASMYGHLEVVEFLIKNGVSINEKGDFGHTALIWASRYGHLEVVKFLIQNEANINEKKNGGDTALILASRWGHLEIVKYLIQNGANINDTNDLGWTALFWAKKENKTELIDYLSSLGAN